MTESFEEFYVKKVAADRKLTATEKLVAIVFMFVSEPSGEKDDYVRVGPDIAAMCGLSKPEFKRALDKVVVGGWAVSAQAVRELELRDLELNETERATLH